MTCVLRRLSAVLLACACCVAALIPVPVAAQAWSQNEWTLFPPLRPFASAEVSIPGGGKMIARCEGGDFSMNWRPGFRLDNPVLASVQVTWPDQVPKVESWQYDPSLTALSAEEPVVLARRIVAGRTLVLGLADRRGRMRAVTVPGTGAAVEVGRVMETCGRNPTDFETARPDIDPDVVAYVDGVTALDGYLLRWRLLGEQRIESRSPRPTELYEAVNLVWRDRLPALCRDEASTVWSATICMDFREALAADPAARIPAPVGRAVFLYLQGCCEGQALDLQRRRAESQASNSCGEPDTDPVPLTSFPVHRAYPSDAIQVLQQGVIAATVQVDANGQVVDVVIRSAHPVGIFESVVEREFRTMQFKPATRNCAPVPGAYLATIVFAIAH